MARGTPRIPRGAFKLRARHITSSSSEAVPDWRGVKNLPEIGSEFRKVVLFYEAKREFTPSLLRLLVSFSTITAAYSSPLDTPLMLTGSFREAFSGDGFL